MKLIDMKHRGVPSKLSIISIDPTVQYLAALLILACGVAFTIFILLLQDQRTLHNEALTELSNAQRDYRLLKQLGDQQQLLQYEQELQTLVGKLSMIQTSANYVAAMTKLADEAGVNVKSELYRPPVTRDGKKEQSVKLNIETSYFQLQAYLSKLGDLPFLAREQTMKVDRKDNDTLSVSLEILAVFGQQQ